MPSGDDVTGLHAFDDLDPVSTVSALNVMQEPEHEPALPQVVSNTQHAGAYSRPSTLPPPGGSAPPPPLPRAGALPPPSGASALPPPSPRGGVAVRSVPPPPPARRDDAQADGEFGFDDDNEGGDTKVVAQQDYAYDEYDGLAGDTGGNEPASSDARDLTPASTARQGTGIDDTALLELSATTVATSIEMDWDEEEVQTKLRDDHDGVNFAAPPHPASGRPSPFPAPVTSSASYPGNPSPFASRSSFPPPVVVAPDADGWGDDEMTRVMRSSLPPPPSIPDEWNRSGARTPVRGADTLVGAELEPGTSNKRWTLIGFAAVGVIAMAIVARALFSSPEAATVTLTTSPIDAQVMIDGKVLSGQTSPFTVQGLSPSIAHSIEVHKDGYATFKQDFEVHAGEIKPLPGIELAPLRVDTGFALSSVPAGASVYVDDHKLDGVTPMRVNDMSEGLHVVRLQLASGFQPWETQVALAKGQVIELPTARLVPSAPGAASHANFAQHDAPAPRPESSSSSVSASSGSSHHHSSSSSGSAHAIAPSSMPGPSFMPQASAPKPAPVAAAGGGQGILRVNSRPWSQVFIDGRMIGNTPQLNVPLSPGKHKVKLVNPQLGMSKGFDVTIAAGKPTTKIVELME